MAALVSVIVPCYNVEPYIERCIRSLLLQTMLDVDIICIDDGSTDDTLSMLNWLAGTQSRIRVVSQENAGPYHARLHGIELVESEWIAFVDSDDEVTPDHLEIMYKAAQEPGTGMVVTGIARIFENGKTFQYVPPFRRIDKDTATRMLLTRSAESALYSCSNKLYRRDVLLLDHLQGSRISYGDDLMFNLRILNLPINFTIVGLNVATYKYYARDGSILRSMASEHIEDFFSLWAELDLRAGRVFDMCSSGLVEYEHIRSAQVMNFFGNVYRSRNLSLIKKFVLMLNTSKWKMFSRTQGFLELIRWLNFKARIVCAKLGIMPALFD